MAETATGDLRSVGELELRSSAATADKPVRVLLFAPSAAVEEARQRVHIADAAEREKLAHLFVNRLRDASDIREIWLGQTEPSLVLALLVSDITLDRELELRAQFADLTFEHEAELKIYTDERASFARRGEKLLG